MKKIALSPTDTDLILKYIRGGLLLGGGVGAATGLMAELRDAGAPITGADQAQKKDVLTLHLRDAPKPKMASVLRAPAAILGAGAGVLGGYAGVRALQQWWAKKKLEKELDEAQNAYLDVLTPTPTEAQPKRAAAGKPLSLMETASAAPLTLAALTAIASGVVANQALGKMFPARRSALRMRPRRVVIHREGAPDGEDLDSSVLLDKSAAALLIETTAHLQPAGLESDFFNVIKAASTGQLPAMRWTLMTSGIEAMLATVGGHSSRVVDAGHLKLAARAIAEDPAMCPAVELLAALEFAEVAPRHCKMASALSDDEQDLLINFGVSQSDLAFAEDLGEMIDERAEAPVKNASTPYHLLHEALQAA